MAVIFASVSSSSAAVANSDKISTVEAQLLGLRAVFWACFALGVGTVLLAVCALRK
jgi:hypothetical protein